MKLGAENDWYTLVFRVKSREEYLNCWRCVALNATSFIHVVHRRIMTKMKRCRGDRGWPGKMRKGKKAKVTKTSESREILSRISILFAKRYNKIPGERAISKFVGSSNSAANFCLDTLQIYTRQSITRRKKYLSNGHFHASVRKTQAHTGWEIFSFLSLDSKLSPYFNRVCMHEGNLKSWDHQGNRRLDTYDERRYRARERERKVGKSKKGSWEPRIA